MKFAIPFTAVLLAQAACVAAVPGRGHKKHFPGGKGGRHRHSCSSGAPPAIISAAPVNSPPPAPIPAPSEEPETPVNDSAPPIDLPGTPSKDPAEPETSGPPPAPPVQSDAAPPPASSPPPSGGSSSPGLVCGGKPVIDSVNDYRGKAGLPLMSWDDGLATNAGKTGNDAGGKALTHQLNPGTFGQVLVFGFDDADKCDKDIKSFTPFEVYFLSWLCERPEDPALGGICPQIFQLGRIDNEGQTGHHDLLAKASFTKIGCAFARDPSAAQCSMFPGVWACDLA